MLTWANASFEHGVMLLLEVAAEYKDSAAGLSTEDAARGGYLAEPRELPLDWQLADHGGAGLHLIDPQCAVEHVPPELSHKSLALPQLAEVAFDCQLADLCFLGVEQFGILVALDCCCEGGLEDPGLEEWVDFEDA
jgi:hypothetical protein